LLTLSKKVRHILDSHGLQYVKIFASGDLDEYAITDLLKNDAEIDAFGVGTRMSTSFDRPYVDVVYKLSGIVERGTFVPTMKLSKGKITLPGKKQVFRQTDKHGKYVRDIIGFENEKVAGEPLLIRVMERGRDVYETRKLDEIRTAITMNFSQLPDKYKKHTKACRYPVKLSPALMKIKRQLTEQLRIQERSK
jgi:nicotinate phosphoribosyltransferase